MAVSEKMVEAALVSFYGHPTPPTGEFGNPLFSTMRRALEAAEAVRGGDAAQPAGTVAVRVAVAFADDGSVWAETLYDPDCSSWAELAANGYSRRSCIATIHAPLPVVAEVGAVVEDPTP